MLVCAPVVYLLTGESAPSTGLTPDGNFESEVRVSPGLSNCACVSFICLSFLGNDVRCSRQCCHGAVSPVEIFSASEVSLSLRVRQWCVCFMHCSSVARCRSSMVRVTVAPRSTDCHRVYMTPMQCTRHLQRSSHWNR